MKNMPSGYLFNEKESESEISQNKMKKSLNSKYGVARALMTNSCTFLTILVLFTGILILNKDDLSSSFEISD